MKAIKTQKDFHDLINDCLKDEVSYLYVSESTFQEIKTLVQDKSENKNIRILRGEVLLLNISVFESI